MKGTLTSRVHSSALIALLTACAPDSQLPTGVNWTAPAFSSSRHSTQFSEWSAPVNVGPPVNRPFVENAPAISRDGLTLYFQCECPDGFGGVDIYVSRRAKVDDPWGPPENLGPNINTSSNDGNPSFSRDGRTMYMISNRPGGFGGNDLYVAQRKHKHDDFDWQSPVNLGSNVNTSANEGAPQPYEDRSERTTLLYFFSNRPGGLGGNDIYASKLGRDQTFEPATHVTELSSAFGDTGPSIRHDGLEMFLVSDRPGTIGFLDLWVSTRKRTSDPWSPPMNLGPNLNGPGNDGGAELAHDANTLYFHSAGRPQNVGGNGFFDIWFTTREKLR